MKRKPEISGCLTIPIRCRSQSLPIDRGPVRLGINAGEFKVAGQSQTDTENVLH